LHQENDY